MHFYSKSDALVNSVDTLEALQRQADIDLGTMCSSLSY